MVHVVIVGAYGSAGAAVADELADEPDIELTLIDDGDPGGGLCILRGCMPSKEVLSAAEARYRSRHDDRLVGAPPELDLEAIVERKDGHTSNWAAHRRTAVDRLTERENVTLLRDTARLVDDRVVVAGDRRLEADYLVVATGSTPNVPELPGLDEVDCTTSAEVLDATSLPDSGVVMGFGYVGLELVPYLVEAGVDLTVIEHDDRPLDGADPAFGDALLDIYREAFDVEVLTRTSEERVEPTGDGVCLHVERDGETRTVEAGGFFTFTGRRPNLPPGVDRTRLDPGPGWVEDTMQARDDERVFVVGDANGKEPVLHVAKEQGYVAADNVLNHCAGRPLDTYENVTHRVLFSGAGVYPFARVGHTAGSADEAGLEHFAVTRQARDDGVFLAKAAPRGLARLVVGADGTVLGYQGLHYQADAIAKTMQVVVEGEMDVRDVPDRSYHPTTPEILDGLLRDAKRELDRTGG